MEELTQLAKAFSDINRLKIITLVQRDVDICVCEICDTLELSQPLVSRHLKQLVKSNILSSKQIGKWVHYRVVEHPSEFLQPWLNGLEKFKKSLPVTVSCNLK